MPGAEPQTAAHVARRIRTALLAWPDLKDVYGPAAATVAGAPAYFLRFVMADGGSFSIELLADIDSDGPSS